MTLRAVLVLLSVFAFTSLFSKEPVPSPLSLKDAEKRIKRAFGAKLAREKDGKKLADRLMTLAHENRDDATLRYALLHRARETAARIGRGRLTLKAHKALDEGYEIQRFEEGVEVLQKVAKRAEGGKDLRAITAASAEYFREAVRNLELAAAAKLLKVSEIVAKRQDSDWARARVDEDRKLLAELKKWERANKDSLEQVLSNPDAPRVKGALGEFFGFYLEDWYEALPLLRKGPEGALRDLATADLQVAYASDERLALAGRWAGFAKSAQGRVRDSSLRRAAYWYRAALEDIDIGGAGRLEAQEGMLSLGRLHLADFAPEEAIVGHGELGTHDRLGYGDDDTARVLVNGLTPRFGISAHPPERGASVVTWHIGRDFRYLEGFAGMHTRTRFFDNGIVFSIWGDGKKLWEGTLRSANESKAFRVKVRGVHVLRLRAFRAKRNDWAQAVWLDPVLTR